MANGIITRRLSKGATDELQVERLLYRHSLKGSSVTVDATEILGNVDVKMFIVEDWEKSSVSGIRFITPTGEIIGGLKTSSASYPKIFFDNGVFTITFNPTGYSIAVSVYALY